MFSFKKYMWLLIITSLFCKIPFVVIYFSFFQSFLEIGWEPDSGRASFITFQIKRFVDAIFWLYWGWVCDAISDSCEKLKSVAVCLGVLLWCNKMPRKPNKSSTIDGCKIVPCLGEQFSFLGICLGIIIRVPKFFSHNILFGYPSISNILIIMKEIWKLFRPFSGLLFMKTSHDLVFWRPTGRSHSCQCF